MKCRYCELIEKLDYFSAVALLGYSLILAILRSFNVKDEATRVMIPAPLISFVATHIMYLNFFKLDHGKYLQVIFILIIIPEDKNYMKAPCVLCFPFRNMLLIIYSIQMCGCKDRNFSVFSFTILFFFSLFIPFFPTFL